MILIDGFHGVPGFVDRKGARAIPLFLSLLLLDFFLAGDRANGCGEGCSGLERHGAYSFRA